MKKFIILIPVYNDWDSLIKLLDDINNTLKEYKTFNEMFHGRDSGGTPDEITSLATVTFLDSPSTTSATTYTVQQLIRADSGASYARSFGSAYGGAIILTEIGG